MLTFLSLLPAILGLTGVITSAVVQGVSAKKNRDAQVQANQQNIAMSEKENAIMREREDNAIQRRAADLSAAGINPLLAGLGQGAQSGSGQLIPMTAPQFNMDTSALGSLGDTLLGSVKAIQENKRIKIDENDKKSQKEKRNAEIAKMTEENNKIRKEIEVMDSDILKNSAQKALLEAEEKLTNAKTESEKKKAKEIQENTKLLTEKINETKNNSKLLEAKKALAEAEKSLTKSQKYDIEERLLDLYTRREREEEFLNLAKEEFKLKEQKQYIEALSTILQATLSGVSEGTVRGVKGH